MSNFQLYQIVVPKIGNTCYGMPGVIRKFITKSSKELIEVWHLIDISLLYEPQQLYATNFINSELEKLRENVIAYGQD